MGVRPEGFERTEDGLLHRPPLSSGRGVLGSRQGVRSVRRGEEVSGGKQ